MLSIIIYEHEAFVPISAKKMKSDINLRHGRMQRIHGGREGEGKRKSLLNFLIIASWLGTVQLTCWNGCYLTAEGGPKAVGLSAVVVEKLLVLFPTLSIQCGEME